MKRIGFLILAIVFASMAVFTGCSREKVEVIDLNKVLDVLTATLEELKDTPLDNVDTKRTDANSVTLIPIDAELQDESYKNLFIERFEGHLNNAKLMSTPIGVTMLNDGSIEGFSDKDGSGVKTSEEKQLFIIEIDAEQNRLIATDTQNNYRRSSGYSLSGGLFTGYLLGSMLGRQRSAGINSSRFSNMKMSDKNYHQSAVSKAKATARSRSGSRSFKTGK